MWSGAWNSGEPSTPRTRSIAQPDLQSAPPSKPTCTRVAQPWGLFWNMDLFGIWTFLEYELLTPGFSSRQDILTKLGKCESYFWNYDSLTGWFNYCIRKSELELKEEEILIWNETFSDQGSDLRQLSLCQFSSLPRSPTPTLSYLFIPTLSLLFIFSSFLFIFSSYRFIPSHPPQPNPIISFQTNPPRISRQSQQKVSHS